MSHLKHSGIIDLLENKELVIPYNKNMIRKFRSPEKSLKEQIQREKNNLSSRTSRMKTQLLNNALHEEANHVSIENERLKINLARNRVYANLLCKGLDSEKLDLSEEWEKQKKTMHTKPKNFTMMKNKQEMELKMSTPELIPMDSSTAGEILSFKRKITSNLSPLFSFKD